jgi:hypothetical protein
MARIYRSRAQMKVKENCLDCIVYCVRIVVTCLFKLICSEGARICVTNSVRDCESTEKLMTWNHWHIVRKHFKFIYRSFMWAPMATLPGKFLPQLNSWCFAYSPCDAGVLVCCGCYKVTHDAVIFQWGGTLLHCCTGISLPSWVHAAICELQQHITEVIEVCCSKCGNAVTIAGTSAG